MGGVYQICSYLFKLILVLLTIRHEMLFDAIEVCDYVLAQLGSEGDVIHSYRFLSLVSMLVDISCSHDSRSTDRN